MKYIYIPNSIKEDRIVERFKTENEYVDYQFKYRNLLETIILQSIDENKIASIMTGIPKCDDNNYNFYHKNTLFKNGYLFLRNNIHIENLTDDELKLLKEIQVAYNKECVDLVNKTLFRVINEGEGISCYGDPIPKNMVGPNSLVFELAYNALEFKDANQWYQVDNANKKIYDYLKGSLGNAKINVGLVTYNMMSNLYLDEDNIIYNLQN